VSRKAFAKILKSLRSEKGLSQEELGFRANLHRTFISQLERGLKSPTLDTLYDICGVLGITGSALLEKMETEAAKSHRR
jgi:transcriptional regulator with XRE-family HTH domain